MAEPLVVARDLPRPRPPARRPRPGEKLPAALKFRLARWSRSELILFDDAAGESWILYPPRSHYARRRLIVGDALVVEHRVWSGNRDPDQHVVRPTEGCVRHGLACGANEAIQAAVDAGFDPFA
ncbi:MAG TPA: hypothetical protein VG370_13320 [Chloroflexota bacterium]|nr:hypothetical protein [Chloroflexota bacterium]